MFLNWAKFIQRFSLLIIQNPLQLNCIVLGQNCAEHQQICRFSLPANPHPTHSCTLYIHIMSFSCHVCGIRKIHKYIEPLRIGGYNIGPFHEYMPPAVAVAVTVVSRAHRLGESWKPRSSCTSPWLIHVRKPKVYSLKCAWIRGINSATVAQPSNGLYASEEPTISGSHISNVGLQHERTRWYSYSVIKGT